MTVISDNACYRLGIACIDSDVFCLGPEQLKGTREGHYRLYFSSIVVINVEDYQVLLAVIHWVRTHTRAQVFIEYSRRAFNATAINIFGVSIRSEKMTPKEFKAFLVDKHEFKTRMAAFIGNDISCYEWQVLPLLMNGASGRKASLEIKISEKQLSACKCRLARKLHLADMNTATEIRLMNLLHQLFMLKKPWIESPDQYVA